MKTGFIMIILATIICIGTLSFYLLHPIYQTINISNVMMAKTVPFEQHPSNPNQHILVAGDSTAVGVGAEHSEQSIAGRLGKQFPDADISNLGVNGARLNDLIAILRAQDKNYDLIVLQIGANDITHFTPYSTIRNELAEILHLSATLSPKTIILTAGNIGNAPMFRWPLSSFIAARTLNVRAIFIEETAKNPTSAYVDLFKSLEEDPMVKNVKKFYSPDMFHLSGDGYAIWYSSFQKKL